MPASPVAPPVSEVDVIRADFPALRRQHRGYPVAYFDGPGGTQVPAVVAVLPVAGVMAIVEHHTGRYRAKSR